MTFNDAMVGIGCPFKARPDAEKPIVKFMFESLICMRDNGYVKVRKGKLKCRDGELCFEPENSCTDCFIIAPYDRIDKMIIKECINDVIGVKLWARYDALHDMTNRIKVKVYRIEDVNWSFKEEK